MRLLLEAMKDVDPIQLNTTEFWVSLDVKAEWNISNS